MMIKWNELSDVERNLLVLHTIMGVGKPPRGYALAKIGSSITAVTGDPWKLQNGGVVTPIPNAHDLPQPAGTTDWNARYFAYVAEHANLPDLEERIAKIDYDPKPYTTDIDAAWDVVRVISKDRNLFVEIHTSAHHHWCGIWYNNPQKREHGWKARKYALSVPEAICLAGLKLKGLEIDVLQD